MAEENAAGADAGQRGQQAAGADGDRRRYQALDVLGVTLRARCIESVRNGDGRVELYYFKACVELADGGGHYEVVDCGRSRDEAKLKVAMTALGKALKAVEGRPDERDVEEEPQE